MPKYNINILRKVGTKIKVITSTESNWAYEEFKDIVTNCKRTTKRLIKSLMTLSKKPQESIAGASQNKAEAKAIYRLLNNKKIAEENVMATHKIQTIKRIEESKEKVILSIQDTSEINYTGLKATIGLGSYGGCEHSKGLIVHSTIAVTPNGIVKGLLDQKIWAREMSERGKRNERAKKNIENKESNKWLESMEKSNKDIPENIKVINICDREGDIYEFFNKAVQQNKLFLVRATHNRKISENEKLFDKVNNERVLGEVTVAIPRDTRKKTKKREAILELKYVEIEIPIPLKKKKFIPEKSPIKLTVILAKEINPSKDIEPIKWYLITNLEISNVDDVFEKIKWYVQRWKIERFHYILKSGCKIEELQEKTAEKLKKLILIYSIIALRILWITYLAREFPEISCIEILEEEEWKVLYCIANKTTSLPLIPPILKDAVMYIAKLGGFLGRKGDGDPGAKVIWRGLKELNVVITHRKYLNFTSS